MASTFIPSAPLTADYRGYGGVGVKPMMIDPESMVAPQQFASPRFNPEAAISAPPAMAQPAPVAGLRNPRIAPAQSFSAPEPHHAGLDILGSLRSAGERFMDQSQQIIENARGPHSPTGTYYPERGSKPTEAELRGRIPLPEEPRTPPDPLTRSILSEILSGPVGGIVRSIWQVNPGPSGRQDSRDVADQVMPPFQRMPDARTESDGGPRDLPTHGPRLSVPIPQGSQPARPSTAPPVRSNLPQPSKARRRPRDRARVARRAAAMGASVIVTPVNRAEFDPNEAPMYIDVPTVPGYDEDKRPVIDSYSTYGLRNPNR